MKTKLLLVFGLCVSSFLFSQETETANGFYVTDEVTTEKDSRFYVSYFSEIKIDAKWTFRQELVKFSLNDYSQIEFPLLMKYSLTPKWSVLFGPKINLYRDDKSGQIEHISLFSSMGIQYDATKNLLFEGRFDSRIDNGNHISENYIFDANQTYKFGSKFKF